ncbi:glycosyltransferase family 2 protein [Neobacillus notoginsengisoli]|uniref:Glycosyltransferase family 2 protein n=1 Tax=Neobacillus notoginsengisoli TaxID=1578198 RepID=A0A417YYJ5_9BACI|nr:glycosyltransferase family 2 protein [Neobacillus notoginsengisoli]RHW42801.1 glycosyltransferase family 2 protein [Neobacillus notoginsengisoli]
MGTPFLSIVIPVFNAERTISRAIGSILSQDFMGIEIIVINDGSTDRSHEICQDIARNEPRIKLFSIENSGVSYARNVGIEQAQGKYITFLDADDFYVETALKQMAASLTPNIELMIFGYNVDFENKYSDCLLPSEQMLTFHDQHRFRDYAVSLIRNEMINAPWNKVYLTSYLKEKEIKFPADLNIGEDLKFNLAVIRDIEHVKILNLAFVNYCVKKGEGLVSRFRLNRFDVRYDLLMEIRNLLSYWGILKKNQAMIDRFLIRDIMAYFMDFYKRNCQLTYQRKLELIRDILSRKEIREVIAKNHPYDFSTIVIEQILKTNNSKFILFLAKILNIKRVLR